MISLQQKLEGTGQKKMGEPKCRGGVIVTVDGIRRYIPDPDRILDEAKEREYDRDEWEGEDSWW